MIDARTYYELKAFYAEHLAARDAGDVEAWLDAFEPDSSLVTNVFAGTVRMTKPEFTPKVHQLDAEFASAGIQRRHEPSTYVFGRDADGTVHARFYTVLLTTDPDGAARVHSTSVGADRLRRTDAGWRVLSRQIWRDDLAPSGSKPEIPNPAGGEEEAMTDAVRYSEVERFYARQMQLIDEGDADGWAATFTEDGVFTSNGTTGEVRGRPALRTAAKETIARLTGAGTTRRHIVSNVRIEQLEPDLLRVTSYVPVIDTTSGVAALRTSTVMSDELALVGSDLLVRHRLVELDGKS